MPNASKKRSRQGSDEMPMAVMGDSGYDVFQNGDEYSPTHEVLNGILSVQANNHRSYANPRANAGKVSSRSGVTVSRSFIILAMLLFTALISALTGLTVYYVTTSKTNNEGTLSQQEPDITELNRRLDALQEKHSALKNEVHGLQKSHNSSDMALRDYNASIDRRLDALDSVVQMVPEISKRLDALQEKHTLLNNKVQDLHNSSDMSSHDCNASIDRRLEALDSVVQMVPEISKRLDALQEKHTVLNNKVQDLHNSSDMSSHDYNASIDRRLEALDSVVQTVSEISKRLDALQEKHTVLNNKVQDLHNSSDMSSHDYNASIDRRLEALGSVVQMVPEISKQLDALHEKHIALNNTVQVLQKSQNASDMSSHDYNASFDRRIEALDSVVQMVPEISKRLDALQEKHTVLNNTVQVLQKSQNASDMSSHDYNASIDRQLEALGSVVQMVPEISKRLDALHEKHIALNDKVQVLQKSQNASDMSSHDCNASIDRRLEALDSVVQMVPDISKRLDALQEKHTVLKNEVQDLHNSSDMSPPDYNASIEALLQTVQATLNCSEHGSTYTRWGKTSCSGNGTELVYSGYAGGSMFDHIGAASSYLCLPGDPQWGRYDDRLQSYGLLYGAEYEFFDRRKWFPNAALDNNVPCAVCRSPRASVLMIPGRYSCYGNWTVEYHGYLMSGAYFHKAASDYACLDEHPESVIGGSANHNGKLFYIVEGRCGSLPCPPYVNGRELTCVVCSK